MEKLFVYGTLRRNERNHRLLGSSSVDTQIAFAKGGLVDTGFGFPAMTSSMDGLVNGELYEVGIEELLRVDVLEGFYGPGDSRNYYERIRIDVQTDKGVIESWAYIHEKPVQGQVIPYGDWKLYRMCEGRNILYFAYGSCMDLKRIEEAGVADWFTQVVGRGILNNCNLQFTRRTDDGGRADLVETGGYTEGKLYYIPKQALSGYLYGREGVTGNIYRPIVITVQGENGQSYDALTFVVVNKQEEDVPPNWYMEEILRGASPIVSKGYYLSLVDRFVSKFGYPLKEAERG